MPTIISIAIGVNRFNRLGKNRQSLRRLLGNVKAKYLCEGSFVCHYCGFQRPIRCDACEEVQRVDIEEPYMKNLGDKFLGGDVLCGGCRYIITTLYTLVSAA